MKNRILFVILLIGLAPILLVAQNTDSNFQEVSKSKDWQFVISPYAWLAGNATDVGGESLRQSFNDLSSLTNFGFQMTSSVRYKRYIISLDWTYAHLATGMGGDLLTVDANVHQWIVDPKIGYFIYNKVDYKEEAVIAGWSLEANIGAKYWSNNIEVDYALHSDILPIEGSINEKQDWWDIMLGAKARFILSKSVLLSVAGDIGGFGLGNSSDLSYDFTYANSFKVSRLILVTAGYRSFKYKRTDGSGENKLKTKVNAYGPFLGVSFVL
ncbi:hypothetical protein [Carboxylicivirga sp. RSCT41]|uniref:hypothetical protein n=1 Tax=Carboxylicivirga agarovorans TaxID=3417570 RepID=UPI003D3536B2